MSRPVSSFDLFLYSVFLMFSLCVCNKYSKESNIYIDDADLKVQEIPFRMKKTNLLWDTGKKVLSGPKLADLYADLKIHDKNEAHLKKLKSQDMDKDGEMEAKVLTNYRRIVENYGLDILAPNHQYMSNEIPLDDSDVRNVNFQDSKLQSLWRKAQEAGFSEKALKILKDEFWHQQMKIDEHDFVHKGMDDIAEPNDNSVESEQEKINPSNVDDSEKSNALRKSKEKIYNGYLKLEQLVASMPASDSTFQDSRVLKLWAMAKKTNWTEEQLNGFKEELQHFEHRLNKQTYYEQQLKLSRKALQDLEEGADIPDNHKHLEEKHASLVQKVKKLHLHFKSRIDEALQHTEL